MPKCEKSGPWLRAISGCCDVEPGRRLAGHQAAEAGGHHPGRDLRVAVLAGGFQEAGHRVTGAGIHRVQHHFGRRERPSRFVRSGRINLAWTFGCKPDPDDRRSGATRRVSDSITAASLKLKLREELELTRVQRLDCSPVRLERYALCRVRLTHTQRVVVICQIESLHMSSV